MTGIELKTWVESANIKHRKLARKLERSIGTLYNWYNSTKPLPRLIVFAVAYLGCEKAKAELDAENAA